MKIDEAKKVIRRFECNSEHYEACEMAIKSLEAWGEIKQEIKQLADYDTIDVLVDVMRIINKHMGEVTT